MNSYPNFADGTPAGLACAVLAVALKENPDYVWQDPDGFNFWVSLTGLDADSFRRRLAGQLQRRSA